MDGFFARPRPDVIPLMSEHVNTVLRLIDGRCGSREEFRSAPSPPSPQFAA